MARLRRAILLLLLGGTITTLAAAAPAGGAAGSREVLERGLREMLREDPEAAWYVTVPEDAAGGPYAARLTDLSPAAERRRRATMRRFLRDLGPIAARASSDAETTAVAVARWMLERNLAAASVPYGRIQPFYFTGHSPYVFNAISGPLVDTPAQMAGQAYIASPSDAERYIRRLRAFPNAFAAARRKLRADAALGVVPPRAILEAAIGAARDFGAMPARENVLYTAFESRLGAAVPDEAARSALLNAAARAIEQQVYPAFARVAVDLEALRARAPAEGGLWQLPGGEQIYRASVRLLGDTELDPAAIHALGLREVARLQPLVQARLDALGAPTGTLAARLAALPVPASQRYAAGPEGERRALEDVRGDLRAIGARLGAVLPAEEIPPLDLEVRRVPRFAEASVSAAYYDPPSIDQRRPGTYWLNLRDVTELSRSVMRTTTFHEGVPGHHLQSAFVLQNTQVPLLQRLANLNGFNEGWGVYAEQLAAELGLYADDPAGDLGRLRAELHRAARLVVDTGLHAQRWTRAQGIDYLVAEAGLSRARATSETDRYLTWPGQALGYQLGLLEIRRLRAACADRAGAAFDLRRFHVALLRDGSLPFEILRRRLAASGVCPAAAGG